MDLYNLSIVAPSFESSVIYFNFFKLSSQAAMLHECNHLVNIIVPFLKAKQSNLNIGVIYFLFFLFFFFFYLFSNEGKIFLRLYMILRFSIQNCDLKFILPIKFIHICVFKHECGNLLLTKMYIFYDKIAIKWKLFSVKVIKIMKKSFPKFKLLNGK